MKKFLSLALILASVSGLFACGSNDEWGNFTFGEEGDKTVLEQRKEIQDAMTLAMNTEVVWKEIENYNPTNKKYSHIKSITYDGLEYMGQKTKIFAYMGFPEGASAESPVPAVVLVHGGGGHPYLEWVRKWNERGYAAIAMDTTGYFPLGKNACIDESRNDQFTYGMTEDFYEEGYINAPDRFFTAEYTEVSEQWAYHGLSQVILAGNILRQDERVDGEKIGITGISWGGVMVSQVIGYDNRFAFAIPAYGTAYLGDEMRPFDMFAEPYVDALWAAERNLDNAKMPILWYAYSDDVYFGVNSYVKSYEHTKSSNEKTSLLMLVDFGHSHNRVIGKEHSFLFADYAIGKGAEWVSFETEPLGKDVNCKINIPAEITGDITATVYYITEPMSYSVHDKFGKGENMYLDQVWQVSADTLTLDRESGILKGTLPDEAKGYYINLAFNIDDTPCEISSTYVSISE